jgi:hypothetical protein
MAVKVGLGCREFRENDGQGKFYPAICLLKLPYPRDNGNKRGIVSNLRGWHQLYQQ